MVSRVSDHSYFEAIDCLRTTTRNMKLLARWVIFTSLLIAVVPVMQGRLRGCAFCIAHDGTIAVIAVDEPQL